MGLNISHLTEGKPYTLCNVFAGSDEGIYAWVAANYALGTLGSHPQNTTGIIELGGASAQVSSSILHLTDQSPLRCNN